MEVLSFDIRFSTVKDPGKCYQNAAKLTLRNLEKAMVHTK